MTAFERYQRLEGPGLWAASAQDQRRDVVIRFGEATLIIADARSEQVLSHWSLAATRRLNPGDLPALFAPLAVSGASPEESLELDDPILIEALDTLQRALSPARGWWARGRTLFIAVSAVVVLLLAIFWLPDALVRHTASVVPLAKRIQISQAALAQLATEFRVETCAAPRGVIALERLNLAVFDTPRTLLVVRGLPAGALQAFHLPGRLIVIDAALVERLNAPGALAGVLLAEAERAGAEDPLHGVLRHAGVQATLRLLTTGDLPATATQGYVSTTLAKPAPALDPQALAARFARAGIDPAPFVEEAASPDLARALGRITADTPMALSPPPLPDEDWVSLQNICDQ